MRERRPLENSERGLFWFPGSSSTITSLITPLPTPHTQPQGHPLCPGAVACTHTGRIPFPPLPTMLSLSSKAMLKRAAAATSRSNTTRSATALWTTPGKARRAARAAWCVSARAVYLLLRVEVLDLLVCGFVSLQFSREAARNSLLLTAR